MRLIGTIESEKMGKRFSTFLSKNKIVNQCEMAINTDWGSDGYGTPLCKIWVYDEDQVLDAQKWYDLFLQHPDDPSFDVETTGLDELADIFKSNDGEVKEKAERTIPLTIHRLKQPFGPITLYLLLICGWLFIWGKMTTPSMQQFPAFLPPTPILSPAVNKALLYDYPETFVLVDKLVRLYGLEKLQDPNDLPEEGQFLLIHYLHTPYWQGIYHQLISHWQNSGHEWTFQEPMFEKIRKGEVWRLVTPCFLHYDIFHILFNMIWLLVLGKQMEGRLSPLRYVVFIILAAVVTNTSQYLMSGSNFIGFSGVLCAMLTFIWTRQRRAAWEGYELQRSTFGLMIVFILTMFAIQIGSFFIEINWHQTLSPGIANTAHLSGAALGLLLGRLEYFRWKAD